MEDRELIGRDSIPPTLSPREIADENNLKDVFKGVGNQVEEEDAEI